MNIIQGELFAVPDDIKPQHGGESLPPSMQRLVDCIGLSDTLTLIQHYREREGLYIPMHIKPGHELHGLLDDSQRAALIRDYGGEVIRFPRCKRHLLRLRDSEIRRRRRAGEKVKTLMHDYDLSRSRIEQIMEG